MNFYLNNTNVTSTVLNEIISKNEKYGDTNIGNGENIIVEYSSPNIAKPFHLGHFRNTVLGASLYNMYKICGYNVTRINHLGDWGRQFGLLIEGYKRFKDEYDITKDSLNVLLDIYIRINKLAKEDESIFDIARENFKIMENI